MGQRSSSNPFNESSTRLSRPSSSSVLSQQDQTCRGSLSALSPDTNGKPILSPYFRDLICECFAKAPGDVAGRIIQRTCQHRIDIKQFFTVAGPEVRIQFKEVLHNYLNEIFTNIDDIEMVRRLSRDYGRAHVSLRTIGFKPDFFAALADSITGECTFMGAELTVQSPTNTFKAWTLLVSLMFSSVRDGFYMELRRQRRQTSTESLEKQTLLHTSRGSKGSLSVESNGSSMGNDDSGISHDRISFPSPSPSPLCSAPVSPLRESSSFSSRESSIPRKGSGTILSCGQLKLPFQKLSNGKIGRVEQARQAYSGSRSQNAITPASSTEILASIDKSPGFYRTTNYSHDSITPAPKVPLSGRFQKNVSLDIEGKRKRLEEMTKKHPHLCRKRSSSATSIFDPNSVIDRFMNDQL